MVRHLFIYWVPCVHLGTYVNCRKFFNLFSKGNDNLTIQQFEQGIMKIVYANFEFALKLTFDLCDFNNKGSIIHNDVKLILINFIKFCNSFKLESDIYEEKVFE